MNQATERIHVVKFRYLSEFRQWLETNSGQDIIDICTSGSNEDLMILVTYKDKTK
ncbi:hypothetical protein [Ammoniphilus sp. 3BR4]|uniref:hypothetical protein n=1 Tax=Ammoniphilus sp. 3BR4 TaxID=3158265 RepID=UPI0034671B4E